MYKLFISVIIGSILISSCGNKVVLDGRQLEEWLSKPELYIPQFGFEVKTEIFETDKSPHVADYLYVMDNSSSMINDIAKVKAAILAIPKSKYAADGKIAVMTSMISVFGQFDKTHAGINDYAGQYLEPGFLDFVNKSAITKFLNSNAVDSKYQDKFGNLKGCSSKWFSPGAKAKTGEYCLEAALQNPLKGVGCEPNVLAFEQLLLKAKANGTKLFRDGASVHVIFVSDEVHPGCGNSQVNANIPTYAELRSLINLTGTTVAGLKLHGIGKDGAVGSTKYNVSARKRVDASKGTYIPLSSSSYSGVIEKLINSGTYDSPVFALTQNPNKIVSVLVNGKANSDFVITGRAIKIKNLDMSKIYTIKVMYEYQVQTN